MKSVIAHSLGPCGPFEPFLSWNARGHPFLSDVFVSSDAWGYNRIHLSVVPKSVIETLFGPRVGPFLWDHGPEVFFVQATEALRKLGRHGIKS